MIPMSSFGGRMIGIMKKTDNSKEEQSWVQAAYFKIEENTQQLSVISVYLVYC